MRVSASIGARISVLAFAAYALQVACFGASGVAAVDVCYFRLVNTGRDVHYLQEARMAADLWTHFLNINHDDDVRALAVEGDTDTLATRLGVKINTCRGAGKKILLNFHAVGPLMLWFYGKVLPALFVAARGSALAAVAANAAVAPVLNIHSCFPPDFGNNRDVVEAIIEGTVPGGTAIPANRRDEYGQFLFGARGSAASMADWAAGRAVVGDLNALAIMRFANIAAGRMPEAWVTNMLIRRANGQENAAVMCHDGFSGAQPRHHTQKEQCYKSPNNYDQTNVNSDSAVARSDCIRGVVFHIAHNAGTRNRVGTAGFTTPVFDTSSPEEIRAYRDANGGSANAAIAALLPGLPAAATAEVLNHPLASDPELRTIGGAYPDLVGCYRENVANTAFGARKTAVTTVYTSVAGNAQVANSPNARTRTAVVPGVLMSVQARTRAAEDVALDQFNFNPTAAHDAEAEAEAASAAAELDFESDEFEADTEATDADDEADDEAEESEFEADE